jgi:hypothetical protein
MVTDVSVTCRNQSSPKGSPRVRGQSDEDRASTRMHQLSLLLDQQPIVVPGDNELVRPIVLRKADVNGCRGLHPTRKITD